MSPILPAAAARMAKLVEGQHVFFDRDDGTILANLATFTAGGALLQIDLRHVYGDLPAGGYTRF